MASEPGPLDLNEAQRRAMGATLRQVERCLEQIESVLRGPSAGIASRLAPDLDAGERRGLATACERVRRGLAAVRRDLGVEVATRSGRREICGAASIAWAAVEDTKSDALKGYGPLTPEAGAAVDRVLDEVARSLMEVLRQVDHRIAGSPQTTAHPTGM